MARIGKIARLPRALREELNARLSDGATGKEILGWLNGLTEVNAILAAEFDGCPINDPNLTAWRTTGYQEWVNAQEQRALAKEFHEENKGAPRRFLNQMEEVAIAMNVAKLTRLANSPPGDVERRWELLANVVRAVSSLRRANRDTAGHLARKPPEVEG